MSKTNVLTWYVQVTGDASDPQDEGVAGFYQVEVTFTRDVEVSDLTPRMLSAIAEAVLDEFHDEIGIEVLEDFEIVVRTEAGAEVEREDERADSDLIADTSFEGSVGENDLPFDVATMDN